jgi:hypothetical protein
VIKNRNWLATWFDMDDWVWVKHGEGTAAVSSPKRAKLLDRTQIIIIYIVWPSIFVF